MVWGIIKEEFKTTQANNKIVGKIEKGHEERYRALLKALTEGSVFSRPTKVIWECANCGHRVESLRAPELCPVCEHPKAYFFELQEKF